MQCIFWLVDNTINSFTACIRHIVNLRSLLSNINIQTHKHTNWQIHKYTNKRLSQAVKRRKQLVQCIYMLEDDFLNSFIAYARYTTNSRSFFFCTNTWI